MLRASSLVALVGLLAPHVARAQPAEAAATAQFDQGRALVKQKKYAEACAAFEASQRLDPEMGTLYNLAGCHVALGKLATAWAEYRDLEQRDRDAERAKDSGKRATALLSRLPKLRIGVATPLPGLAVKLDGVDVTVVLGTEAPIDLGVHQIDASAPGHTDVHQTAEITAEGKTVDVVLELAPVPSVAGPAHAPTSPSTTAHVAPPVGSPPVGSPPVEPAAHAGHRSAGLVLAGAGVALVGTGLVFGKLASSRWDDAQADCPDAKCASAAMRTAGDTAVSSARGKALLATGFAGAGIVALGVGIALVWRAQSDGRAPSERAAWLLAPAISPTGVGFALDGRF